MRPWVDPLKIPDKDALYQPGLIEPGRLAYAPDRSAFAPILTERLPYPTQNEADHAYRRFVAASPAEHLEAASLWLFGCKPGALDAETARVAVYKGPVVHCATDFLDENGHRIKRRTVNFYYTASAWTMEPVDPPRSSVPWLARESSPHDIFWWVPGRDRYE
jgi:hypothetical protein